MVCRKNVRGTLIMYLHFSHQCVTYTARRLTPCPRHMDIPFNLWLRFAFSINDPAVRSEWNRLTGNYARVIIERLRESSAFTIVPHNNSNLSFRLKAFRILNIYHDQTIYLYLKLEIFIWNF